MQYILSFLILLLALTNAGAQAVADGGNAIGSQIKAALTSDPTPPVPAFMVRLYPDGDRDQPAVTFNYNKKTRSIVCGEYCETGAERVVKAWSQDNGDGITNRILETKLSRYVFTFGRNTIGLRVIRLSDGEPLALFGS